MENRKKSAISSSKLPSTPASRRNPYDFTGCLAHAEVTEHNSDGQITQIFGVLNHSQECQASAMTCIPAVPLHPHVYEVALEQLKNSARYVSWLILFFYNVPTIIFDSITSVQSKNIQMLHSRTYCGMKSHNLSAANVRYEFLPSDASQLYRLFNKYHGVNVTIPSQHNLHNWLNPESPHFNAEICDAIFGYEARTEQHEQLKVCISTREMDNAV